jgi:hypothetical protein
VEETRKIDLQKGREQKEWVYLAIAKPVKDAKQDKGAEGHNVYVSTKHCVI